MATYRYAKITAQGERIGFGVRALQILTVCGLENAIESQRVTYDLARQMPVATEAPMSELGDRAVGSIAA